MLSVMTGRQEHTDRAQLLRCVLEAFPPENDKGADRAIRRRVEGVVIASELAALESMSSRPSRKRTGAKNDLPPE